MTMKRFALLFAISMVVMLAAVLPVLAQGFTDRVGDVLLPIVLPYAPEALSWVFYTLLGALSGFALRKFNIQISDAHIQKAHQALMTASLAGMARGFKGNVLETFIIDAARESSPTAMKKLESKASTEVLRNIVLSKVQIAAQDKLSEALGRAVPR